MVAHLAAQIGVGADALGSYAWAGRSGRRHRVAIIDHLAVAAFDEAAEARFRRWLADDALPREFTPAALDDELSAWFARSRVTRPGAYRLGRILRSAQSAHDDAALQRVANRLDAGMRDRLGVLLADEGACDGQEQGMAVRRFGAGHMIDAPSRNIARDAAAVPAGPKLDADDPGIPGAAMAHELANLLMVVSGSLEQLRRQPLDERGQKQLARAEWGVRQAARVTRRALSQAQGGEGAPAVADLNAVVGGFAVVMGPQVGEDVRLAAELAPAPLPVRLDAGLLELVLLNLVRNAADAMPEGGQVVLLTKGPRLDGLGDQLAAEVAVADTGTGMAPDVARQATEAFFTTKPAGKGTGLGLWMAHRFVSTHGGKISIETAPGQGTTVRLSLPYAGNAEPG